MINNLLFLPLLLLTNSFAFAGGGSVIGNGAGLVENNFQFAYNSLNTTVAECVEKQKCEMSLSELKILTEIKTVIQKNISNENRIIFVSEKMFPGFFDTGINEKHRVAKTGLTAEDPIYVNLDLLYTAEGQPAFDFAAITSLLVHEIGHQTGEINHARLDIIGSKIRNFLMKKITSHSLQIGPDNKKVEVTIINQVHPFQSSDMYISWQDVGSAILTQDLIKAINCSRENSTLSGLQIENGHYTTITQNSDHTFTIGFGVWINLSCFSQVDEKMYVERKIVEANIGQDLVLNVTSVEIVLPQK